MNNLGVISIHPTYANAIFGHKKKIEFRRKPISLSDGKRFWVYATLPFGGIKGYIQIKEIVSASPNQLWKNHSKEGFISRKDFNNYFKGCSIAYGLIIEKAVPLVNPILLNDIREIAPRFSPPQFYFKKTPEAIVELING